MVVKEGFQLCDDKIAEFGIVASHLKTLKLFWQYAKLLSWSTIDCLTIDNLLRDVVQKINVKVI